MADETPRRRRRRWPIWLTLAVLALLLAIVFVPPMVSINRYKGRITGLISASLGRPVKLSSVELRLFPRPGFVLTDLTVDEDPAYGSEPVLHAQTVTASVRLVSLWRGLEISRISVDDASLNLERTTSGHWNVESLFRTASKSAGAGLGHGGRPIPLPYLEATESRINIKNGTEKLPFSLVNADVSFWQADPGEWRIRLRGQPARTDVSLNSPDTGLVRLEASVHRTDQLRQIPLHIDLEWKEAQLGQLARLVAGSDPGWRGDLTGEVHLDGTPEAAKVTTRLSASNVHRVEFAPAVPMDFDANCGFVYHYSTRAVEGLECNSPVGDGRIHFLGDLPADGNPAKFSLELDRLPAALGLDALRIVRSGFAPGLEVKGTVSGKIAYAKAPPTREPAAHHSRRDRVQKSRQPAPGPLTGSFLVQGLELSGNGLSQPIRLTKVTLEPAQGVTGHEPGQFDGLTATASIPSGGITALTIGSTLTLSGYQVAVRGQTSIARLRELSHLAGMDSNDTLSALTGEPAQVELSAEGPWLAPEVVRIEPAGTPIAEASGSDALNGTLTFHNVHWKADYLAHPIEIAQATLNVSRQGAQWNPIAFSYGAIKGTASFSVPTSCDAPQGCPPAFEVQFGDLDSGVLEAAVLGATEPGTLFSGLISRFSPAKPVAWPQLAGTVRADSLVLGPVTLEKPSATVRILQTSAAIDGLDADLLGGHIHATGSVLAVGASGNSANKPAYSLDGQFERLSPEAVGLLIGQRWSGGEFHGNGKVDLAGFTGGDLASSARGNLHFEWNNGSVTLPVGADAAKPPAQLAPALLSRFGSWTADASIANGAITLDKNEIRRGEHRSTVAAKMTFGAQPNIAFIQPKDVQTAKQ